jgi:hypothetical protein
MALKEMAELLAEIKRPQDICAERFKPLNLKLETGVEVEDTRQVVDGEIKRCRVSGGSAFLLRL